MQLWLSREAFPSWAKKGDRYIFDSPGAYPEMRIIFWKLQVRHPMERRNPLEREKDIWIGERTKHGLKPDEQKNGFAALSALGEFYCGKWARAWNWSHVPFSGFGIGKSRQKRTKVGPLMKPNFLWTITILPNSPNSSRYFPWMLNYRHEKNLNNPHCTVTQHF